MKHRQISCEMFKAFQEGVLSPLLDAVKKDCEDGALAQNMLFHDQGMPYEIQIRLGTGVISNRTIYIKVYDDSGHINNWITANLNDLKEQENK